MSGRTDSGTRTEIAEVNDVAGPAEEPAGDPAEGSAEDQAEDLAEDQAEDLAEDPAEDARRARWTAGGTGAVLTLAGVTASLMRLSGVPALVPAAYAVGAGVCALAGVLGAKGRTRRALWLLIVGTMIMALGDQFD
ncbi:hypothetical protein ABZ915_37060 [Streptomyces sp. NPDC046915]|uniref:hypothetical protein n=1 Tax=Streptomyces sp. NPDC046915 TaxID=3155257 RepID=UPI0033DC43C1